MTQQKTHEELKKELAGVVAHFQALLDAMEPTPPQPAAPEPASPKPKPPTAVADPVPKPVEPAVQVLLAKVPASLACLDALQKVDQAGSRATLDAVEAQWREAVQTVKPVGVYDNLRPNACSDYCNGAQKRPSPWRDIHCAMRRNETCVLYCKHADDGWTDALWDAAIAHLNENGVRHTHGLNMYNAPDDKKCQYWMLWWPACVSP